MINREKFFKNLRIALFDKFSQLQVDSINAILDEVEAQGVTDIRQIAYIFSTAYHEAFDYSGKQTGTIQRIVPIQEGGSKTYLQGKPYYPYIGYGFVQLTWLANYKKYQNIISKIDRFKGYDIIKNPESVQDIKLAAFILVHGMVNGSFTGKKLSDYIGKKCDFVGARRIINGTDKASLIGSHASAFLTALS